jgi:2,5-diketo-D-gluconate reductase A
MTTVEITTLNDGNTMPTLGLGVWKAADGHEVENAIGSALNAGYRLIDTAMVYRNEEGVGRAVKASGVDRSDVFITTKLWNSDHGTDKVRPALMKSLDRLGISYIDLYLIHWPTPARGLYVETWQELVKLRDEGLIRSIGVSNFQIEHLEELKRRTGTIPAVNQIELHPNFQQRKLRDYSEKNDVRIESWSPLGGSKGNLLENTVLQSIATAHDKSVAQVVIRWHLQHNLIVIPKSTNDERIRQNIDVFDFELSDQDMSAIDGLESGQRSGPNPDTMNLH